MSRARQVAVSGSLMVSAGLAAYIPWASDLSSFATSAAWHRPWLQTALAASLLLLVGGVLAALFSGVGGWGTPFVLALLAPLPLLAAWGAAPVPVRLVARAAAMQLPVAAMFAIPLAHGLVRTLLVCAAAGSALFGLYEVLAWQPIADLSCRAICATNPLHILSLDPGWSQAWADGVRLTIGIGLAIVVPVAYRKVTGLVVGSVLIAVCSPLADVLPPSVWWPMLGVALGLAIHGLVLTGVTSRARERRQRVAELVARLASTRPDGFATALHGPVPGAALAVANAALTAELQSRLSELQSAQTRLLDAWDAARRRWERNLHDGAQHRVLAAAIELSLSSDPAAAAVKPMVQEAADQLRSISRGLHSAELVDHGLAEASRAARDVMGADVRVVASYDGRWPSRLEQTAYLVIVRILNQATGPISVEIGGSPEELVVTARLDQAVTLELGPDLDRVVVVGGQFQVADGTATLRLPVTSPSPVASPPGTTALDDRLAAWGQQ